MTLTSTTNKTAIFPGSFNPFTTGHADIVERGLKLFDRIVIAVGTNSDKPVGDAEAAADAIRRIYSGRPEIVVVVYSCLTVQLARQLGAPYILRGVRSVKDFEYERDMATVNMQLSDVETVILFSKPELSALSSSLVRELQSYGQDISQFLPSNS